MGLYCSSLGIYIQDMERTPVRPQRGILSCNNRETKEPFFSSTWDEFDDMRYQMMGKNQGFWDKVDQDMKEFECCVSKMEAESAPLRPEVPDWALPPDRKHDWKVAEVKPGRGDSEIVQVTHTQDKWQVELDVRTFKPEALKVAVIGDLVTISGNQESNHSSGDNTQSHTTRSFVKKFTLPSGCDPDTLSSSLTATGNLKVSCPRKKWLTGPSPKAIRYS